MYDKIRELAQTYHQETIDYRRIIHRYAETGWLEMKTACLVADRLEQLGYDVLAGEEIMNKDDRMGVPSADILNLNYRRVQQEGVNSPYLEKVKDGMTAVAGILKNGTGPTVAIRFDIDALGLVEDKSYDHFPVQENFDSCHVGMMHACGHDGHTAIGLTTARIMMELKEQWHGTLKLIFQPAEESSDSGAALMVKNGLMDDIDCIIALHCDPEYSCGKIGLLSGAQNAITRNLLINHQSQ